MKDIKLNDGDEAVLMFAVDLLKLKPDYADPLKKALWDRGLGVDEIFLSAELNKEEKYDLLKAIREVV